MPAAIHAHITLYSVYKMKVDERIGTRISKRIVVVVGKVGKVQVYI